MSQLIFNRSFLYDDDYEIRVPIHVERDDGLLVLTDVILDTGASLSVFDVGLATEIGISDVSAGEPRAFRLTNNVVVNAFVHILTLHILGQRMRVPVLISPDLPEGIDNLLGLIGVLDQLDIAILHRERLLYIRA